jgi:hypothetical protein
MHRSPQFLPSKVGLQIGCNLLPRLFERCLP